MYVLAHDTCLCTDRNRDPLLMYELADFLVLWFVWSNWLISPKPQILITGLIDYALYIG